MRTVKADVTVVGGGLAGLVAASEALAHGFSVTLIEKMPDIGGSSVMSGGSLAFANTAEQRAAQIEDSLELLRDDMLTNGGGANDRELVELYVSHQEAAYDFVRAAGETFGPIQLSAGQSVPRTHHIDARRLVESLYAKAIERGMRVLLETRACRLRRGDNSRVLNIVEASRRGENVEVISDSGVILTTGGFAYGRDLLELFVPSLKDAIPGGGLGNEGDGLKMSWAHGAGLADVVHVAPTFGNYIMPCPGQPHTIVHAIYRGGIAVNLAGKRFADESRSYKVLGRLCVQQPEGRAFQIFDSTVMSKSVPGIRAFDFQAALARGHIVQAPTIHELAGRLALSAEALQRTIETYNAGVLEGEDPEFGRLHLAHTSGSRVMLDSPPFYGYPCTAGINTTYGGLSVNPGMSVLDVWANPIPGLFAAGELVGGFHGEGYLSGSALVKAIITGRVAAESALKLREA